MRKFNVTVNGQTYEVEVEEIAEGSAPAPRAAAPAVKAAPAPKAAPAKPAAPAGAAGSEAVKAPMPGTILAVKVQPGDTVKNGQELVTLEAMKMENPIPAPRDGVVASVEVTKGATVEVGAVLVTLK